MALETEKPSVAKGRQRLDARVRVGIGESIERTGLLNLCRAIEVAVAPEAMFPLETHEPAAFRIARDRLGIGDILAAQPATALVLEFAAHQRQHVDQPSVDLIGFDGQPVPVIAHRIEPVFVPFEAGDAADVFLARLDHHAAAIDKVADLLLRRIGRIERDWICNGKDIVLRCKRRCEQGESGENCGSPCHWSVLKRPSQKSKRGRGVFMQEQCLQS